MSRHWYLIHCKPRQEQVALENLERQLYRCYLPTLRTERIRRGVLTLAQEPLFTRYLFVQLDTGDRARSWAPIGSTRGVARLVRFGSEPARVSDELIDALRDREALTTDVQRLFQPGQSVRITAGAFAGIEGVYQMTDGQLRAMVLIEMLSRPLAVTVDPASVRALG